MKSATRYIILQLDQTLLINVYFPCSSVFARDDLLMDCLACILNDITDIQYSNIVFGGDMNIDFSNSSHIGSIIHNFAQDLHLTFADDKIPVDESRSTFRVYTTGAKSAVDHFAASRSLYYTIQEVKIIDSGINVSDHAALLIDLHIPIVTTYLNQTIGEVNKISHFVPKQQQLIVFPLLHIHTIICTISGRRQYTTIPPFFQTRDTCQSNRTHRTFSSLTFKQFQIVYHQNKIQLSSSSCSSDDYRTHHNC